MTFAEMRGHLTKYEAFAAYPGLGQVLTGTRGIRRDAGQRNNTSDVSSDANFGGLKMAIVLDHTIVPVTDRERAVEFYTRIFGFEDLGEVGPFRAVRVNDTLNLDFRESDDFRTIHYAFAMESAEFDAAFDRIKASSIPYGDSPFAQDNMQGPGMTAGAKGDGKAVYFKDPSGHVLEIKTY